MSPISPAGPGRWPARGRPAAGTPWLDASIGAKSAVCAAAPRDAFSRRPRPVSLIATAPQPSVEHVTVADAWPAAIPAWVTAGRRAPRSGDQRHRRADRATASELEEDAVADLTIRPSTSRTRLGETPQALGGRGGSLVATLDGSRYPGVDERDRRRALPRVCEAARADQPSAPDPGMSVVSTGARGRARCGGDRALAIRMTGSGRGRWDPAGRPGSDRQRPWSSARGGRPRPDARASPRRSGGCRRRSGGRRDVGRAGGSTGSGADGKSMTSRPVHAGGDRRDGVREPERG
jgi:hypothetical protein